MYSATGEAVDASSCSAEGLRSKKVPGAASVREGASLPSAAYSIPCASGNLPWMFFCTAYGFLALRFLWYCLQWRLGLCRDASGSNTFESYDNMLPLKYEENISKPAKFAGSRHVIPRYFRGARHYANIVGIANIVGNVGLVLGEHTNPPNSQKTQKQPSKAFSVSAVLSFSAL